MPGLFFSARELQSIATLTRLRELQLGDPSKWEYEDLYSPQLPLDAFASLSNLSRLVLEVEGG